MAGTTFFLAQAAGGTNTDPITWESLATAAGASVMAIILVQFLKIFWKDMSPDTTRQMSATLGVVIVLVAVWIVNDDPGVAEYGLGFLVGIQAGLAASKSVELATAGFNHLVTRR
jgi:hypothetical protein